MNQSKEEQLKEAAENIKKDLLKKYPILTAGGHNDYLLDKNVIDFALMVAESEAAKNYHIQSINSVESGTTSSRPCNSL